MDEFALANRFDRQRPQLCAVAYRILGSLSEADDAVQEAAAAAAVQEVRCGCGGPTPSRSTASSGGLRRSSPGSV
jgi:DNA-directed RNA polymerase specialized sigma24 family protein